MTIEEILARKESQTFDCKSIRAGNKRQRHPVFPHLRIHTEGNLDGGVEGVIYMYSMTTISSNMLESIKQNIGRL